MKKLKKQGGETLVETLVSLLLIVLTFLFLTGAVVSAARVNSRLKNETTAFRRDVGHTEAKKAVTINEKDAGWVTLHTTGSGSNAYVYYD